MPAPYWFALVAATVLVFSSAFVGWRYYKSYIGYGWVLQYERDSGFGRVLSRLVKGPAGKAGVVHGDLVLSCNMTPLSFATPEDMVSHWKQEVAKLKIGDKNTFRVKRGGEVLELELEAGLILGSIPVYGRLPALSDEDREHVKEGLLYDMKVGQWVVTRRPRPLQLEELLG